MSSLIDSTTARGEVLDHLNACRPCAALYAFARDRSDFDALGAWRHQLADHLANERASRAWADQVRRLLGLYQATKTIGVSASLSARSETRRAT
ncbi:MAG TPA: hypothetical protein VFD84_09005 [Candidatus Binatia bacterium]|nr:hypothetical protein [Candidatus Binatia bacterium]